MSYFRAFSLEILCLEIAHQRTDVRVNESVNNIQFHSSNILKQFARWHHNIRL